MFGIQKIWEKKITKNTSNKNTIENSFLNS